MRYYTGKGKLVLIGIILTVLFSHASGFSEHSGDSVSAIQIGVIFPSTPEAVDEEVSAALFLAEQQIAAMLSTPVHKRNETNTIIRLEEILTGFDLHLRKYQILAQLYPDQNLRNAAIEAAEQRDAFLRNIAARDDLFLHMRETKPESTYGLWLYEQEIRFFQLGGAGRSDEEKNQLAHLYQELGSLNNQYITNIRENVSLLENLAILQKTATIRQKIASLQGYATWTDLQADEYGWMTNGTGISSTLDEISPLVREFVQPVVTGFIAGKNPANHQASEISDYEIESLLASSQEEETRFQEVGYAMPLYRTLWRSLSLISCLLHVTTEYIPDARSYAPEVILFRVSDEKTDRTLGWFYLDLTDRPEKTREWMTVLIAGGESGERKEESTSAPVFIVSGIISTSSHDGNITDEEYNLLFHELGHLYTRILTASSESSPVPVILPVELTEASSYLFEYLAWTPDIRGIILAPDAGPYNQTGSLKIMTSGIHDPFSPVSRWNVGRDLGVGILEHRFTQSPESTSFGEVYADIMMNITGVQITDQGGYLLRHPHLVGDTAGTYWIYPVGRLYATILFSRFVETGVFNRTTWSYFVSSILIPEDEHIRPEQRLAKFLNKERIDIASVMKQETSIPYGKNWSFVPGCITRMLTSKVPLS